MKKKKWAEAKLVGLLHRRCRLTHLRNIGRSIWYAAFFNFFSPIRETLISCVAEPSVHATEDPVDPVVSPPLVKPALMVHVKYELKKTAA